MASATKPGWLYATMVLFWVGVGVLSVIQSLISYSLNGWELNWTAVLARNLGWPVWMLLTPPTLWIAGRLRFAAKTTPAVVRFFALNLLIAAGIAAGHFCLELGIKYPLWVRYIDPNPGSHELYSAFFYRFHINILIALFISGVAHAFDFLKDSRDFQLAASKLEAQLARAQVQALKQQLHPHFLFNTHHSIVGMMLTGQTQGAIKMLTQLSDLLRLTLHSGGQQFTTLRAEIHVLELYLAIHLVRLGDRLTVDFEIDPALLDAKVPSLILQPIVENALKHGIEPFTAAATVAVRAHRDEDHVVLEVHDTGPGFDPEDPAHQVQDGLGLRNTAARLEQLYGDLCTLAFVSGAEGFKVRLSFPLEVEGSR